MKARGIIKITIERPNGVTETIDTTDRMGGFLNTPIFEAIRKNTSDAGRGNVLKAEVIVKKTNFRNLVKAYNDFFNEGGDGYIPNEDYFKNSPEYKEWEKMVVFS